MKTINIRLIDNTLKLTDVFQLENRASMLVIDFTGVGVDQHTKYFEFEDANGEKGRFQIGEAGDLVCSYPISNVITSAGELKINPLAIYTNRENEREQSFVPFKTFLVKVQDTINAYGEGSSNKNDIIDTINARLEKLELFDVSVTIEQSAQNKRLDKLDKDFAGILSRVIKNEKDIATFNSRLATVENKVVKNSRTIEEHTEDIEWLKKNGGGGSGSGGNMTPEQVIQLDKATTDNARQDDEIVAMQSDLEKLMSNIDKMGENINISSWSSPDKNNAGIVIDYSKPYSLLTDAVPNSSLTSGDLEFEIIADGVVMYTGSTNKSVLMSFNTTLEFENDGRSVDFSITGGSTPQTWLHPTQSVQIPSLKRVNYNYSLPILVKQGDTFAFKVIGNNKITRILGSSLKAVELKSLTLNVDTPTHIKELVYKLQGEVKENSDDLSLLLGENKFPVEAQSMNRDTWSYLSVIHTVTPGKVVEAFDNTEMTYVKGDSSRFQKIADFTFKRNVLKNGQTYQCSAFVSNVSDSRVAVGLAGADTNGLIYVEPHKDEVVVIEATIVGEAPPQFAFYVEGEVEFYAGGFSVRKSRLISRVNKNLLDVKNYAQLTESKLSTTSGIALTNRTNIGKLDSRTTVLEQGMSGTNSRVSIVEKNLSATDKNVAALQEQLTPTAITWHSESDAWFTKPSGIYYTRDNGVSLKYPADWLFIDHRIQGGDFLNQTSNKGFRQYNRSQNRAWTHTAIEAIGTKNVTVAPGYTLDYYYAKRTGNIISFQFLVRGTFTFNVWKEVIRGIPGPFRPSYGVYAGGGGEGGVAAVAEITKDGTICVNHRFESATRSWFAFSGSYCV